MIRGQVSVITRTKNRPPFLERALDSILASRWSNLEWVIVNDGGAKAPVEEIESLAKKAGLSVTLLHTPGLGMEAASNLGIRASSGEFIHIHDDDDTVLPDFHTRCAHLLSKSSERTVAAATLCVAVDEEVRGGHLIELRQYLYRDLRSLSLTSMLLENKTPPISLVFRRVAWDQVGPFREDLPVLGDWDFHLKLMLLGDIELVPEALSRYHLRPHHLGDASGNSIRNSASSSEITYTRLINESASTLLSSESVWIVSGMLREVINSIIWEIRQHEAQQSPTSLTAKMRSRLRIRSRLRRMLRRIRG